MRHAQKPVYHSAVGTLRTSEEGGIAAGEGRETQSVDENRSVDGGAKIIISSGPIAAASTEIAAPAPVRRAPITQAALPKKQGGIGLVVVLYLLAATALGYAIYERYLM
jgi:hypothetical protein